MSFVDFVANLEIIVLKTQMNERTIGHFSSNCLYNQDSHLFLGQWPEFSLIAT